MLACSDQRSGLPLRDFLRKARATQNTPQQLRGDLGTHLMPHTTHTVNTCFKTFAQPHHRHTGLHPRRHVDEHLAQCTHRRCNND